MDGWGFKDLRTSWAKATTKVKVDNNKLNMLERHKLRLNKD